MADHHRLVSHINAYVFVVLIPRLLGRMLMLLLLLLRRLLLLTDIAANVGDATAGTATNQFWRQQMLILHQIRHGIQVHLRLQFAFKQIE